MEQKQKRQQVRAYLSQYRRLLREKQQLEEQLDRLRRRVGLSSPILTGLPKSTTYYGTADYVADLIELEQQVDASILSAVITCSQISEKIDQMEDPLHRVILRGKYLMGQSLAEIADTAGYSLPRIQHLHGEALDAFPL